MQLELSRYIEGDLDDIADYIAQDNPGRAVSFIQDIRRKFNDIQRSPLSYQLRPDIGEEARMATVGNYAILFRAAGEVVRIERVTYGGRDLPGIIDL
ncbi:MAG: plasmid stabilization system [uncultured bacterium]|nr:MAG: plasmid stabilization system [uncultured bacterium]MDP4029813.1 type II toxin-antitoxin system RelE/ParE family toxin [Gallionella sp.]